MRRCIRYKAALWRIKLGCKRRSMRGGRSLRIASSKGQTMFSMREGPLEHKMQFQSVMAAEDQRTVLGNVRVPSAIWCLLFASHVSGKEVFSAVRIVARSTQNSKGQHQRGDACANARLREKSHFGVMEGPGSGLVQANDDRRLLRGSRITTPWRTNRR